MNRFLTLTVVLMLPFTLAAQGPFPTEEEGKMMMNSTTCVVLEGSPFSEYNPVIREAVTEYWTLTPFEFITVTEFNKRKDDPAYSFIVLTESSYQRDRSGASYSFINLLLGKDVTNIGDMPEFCALALDYAGEDVDAEYAFKLGIIVQFMQSHAKVVIDNPTNSGVRFLKYYNSYVPEVNGKTILAREDDMEETIASEAEIAERYPYPFKLVSEEEIRKAVAERRPNTLILHKTGPRRDLNGAYVFKMLIGTDDAKMYYYNEHRINNRNPDGFLPADLRRLARF